MSQASTQRSQSPSARWPIAAVVGVTLLTYARSLFQGFVWDDGPMLVRNTRFNPPTFQTVAYYGSHPSFNLYQPLTCTLWAACAKFGYVATADENGVHLIAVPFHLLNVLLHVLTTWGVYRLMRTLTLPIGWAAIAAAFFALHPIQVESVAFAGQLNTPLFGCLAVFALDLYLRSTRRSAGVTTGRYSLASLVFVFAMLAQPVALILPFVAIVIDRLIYQRPWRPAAQSATPWILLAIPFAIVTKLCQHGEAAAAHSPLWSRPLVALDNLAWQTLHVIWPVGLSVDYGRSPAVLLARPVQLLSGLLTVTLAATAWRLRRRRPMTTAGLAVAAIALLPSSGIVPFDFEEFSSVADRHAYFAMIGFALALVDTLRRLPARPTFAGIVALLVLLCAMTFRQTGFWKDDVALFSRGVAINPHSWLCHENLAAAQMVSDPRSAMLHFAEAIAIRPGNAGTYDNYAMSAMNAGDPAAAVARLQDGLVIDPNNAGLHQRLADALEQLGRHYEAAGEQATVWRLRRPIEPQQ